MKKIIISLLTTSIFATSSMLSYFIEKDSDALYTCDAHFGFKKLGDEFILCFGARSNLNLANDAIDREDKHKARKYLRKSENDLNALEIIYSVMPEKSVKNKTGIESIKEDFKIAKTYYGETFQ